jgi:glutathione S-transferase
MKLRYSSASPFVRKVLAFAHETGLASQIECIKTDVWADGSDIVKDNPLGKIPALVTPDGTFIGSALCCEYLDSLHRGRRLIPLEMPQRWSVLQRHSLADGMIEASVAFVVETIRRPEAFIYAGMQERQRAKILRTLDRIEAMAVQVSSDIDLASITLGCALGYLDFRLANIDWRLSRPALTTWFAAFDERASMRATKPHL